MIFSQESDDLSIHHEILSFKMYILYTLSISFRVMSKTHFTTENATILRVWHHPLKDKNMQKPLQLRKKLY